MKRILTLALVGLFNSQILCAGDTLSEGGVVNAVLRENPTIKAARAKWEAMKKRVPQARAWEDPMAGVDVERAGTTRFDTFSDAEWMIAQQIPVSGKNLSRGRAASAEAAASFEEFRRVELDAISRARGAYFRLASAYAQLVITHESQDLLSQFAEISRVKYETGVQSQSDVLLAQTDLARLLQTVADLEREISDQRSALNVLMNRPAQSPLGQPAPLSFKPLRISAERARALAVAQRPEIARAQHAITAEESRLQLARRLWIPDPQFRVEARQFNGQSGIQEYDTGVFISVPWVNFGKYSAGVSEAQKSVEMAQHQLEAARTETMGLVQDQLKKIETAARNYELFNGKIVPLARQAIESTRAGYESDKTSFLELITAQRTLREAQSSALNQLAAHQIAIAELRAVIGSDSFAADAKDRKRTEEEFGNARSK
jgi:cobalt-zinc-cadmium efflux system outer membrane protein